MSANEGHPPEFYGGEILRPLPRHTDDVLCARRSLANAAGRTYAPVVDRAPQPKPEAPTDGR